MSTFLDINLLLKIIEGFSQKGVQASSGLACQWVIPGKIHTPTTEGMLENLMGEGVNGSGNLDCTHLSCYESFPKGYNECIQPPLPLRKNHPLAAQLKSPFGDYCFSTKKRTFYYLLQYILLYILVQEKREVRSNMSLFANCVNTTNTEIKEN